MEDSDLAAPAQLMRLLDGYLTTQLLYVAAKLGVPEALQDGPKDAAEIARELGIERDDLHRALRGLAIENVLSELDDGRFGLTPIGQCLISLRGAALVRGELYYEAAGKLLDAFSGTATPFERAYGETFFEHLDGHAGHEGAFQESMAGRAEQEAQDVVDAYDFGGFEQLVDVGGGRGILLSRILRAHPGLHGVLFDRDQAIESAAEHLQSQGVDDRVSCVSGDFFTSIPSGGDAYLLSRVLHDWDDADAGRILGSCRDAMQPTSRLLIVDAILPDRASDRPAAIRMDLHMLVLLGARERTESEFRALLDDNGFRFEQVVRTRSVAGLGIVEASQRLNWVLHVDLDQFLAAVEVRRRPELAGLPVVVGGDGNPRRPRQVVATASYEARAFGIRSGMPLGQALRRCPDAIFLPSDRPAYDAASAEVMATLRTFPATVEVWGWDEAFLGVTTEDPEAFAYGVKARIAEITGLSCAVGIGDTRLLAKTATGSAKPGGVARLTRREWIPTMGGQPVTAIWGIGNRTAARLGELGIVTVEDLARADHNELARSFGPTIGPHLRILGLGGDDSPIVDEPHVARGRSREETFTTDVSDPAAIAGHVERLAREVTADVVHEGRRVTHVAVKVRTATFFTRTKISKLPAPTTDPDTTAAMALTVLDRFGELRPVRLLGVRVVLEMPSA